eukprot:377230-Pelagomonas_calceolata.AAC.1
MAWMRRSKHLDGPASCNSAMGLRSPGREQDEESKGAELVVDLPVAKATWGSICWACSRGNGGQREQGKGEGKRKIREEQGLWWTWQPQEHKEAAFSTPAVTLIGVRTREGRGSME